MDKKVTAICCGATDWKESDKIATLCSIEEGKISAVVKGCRKQNAKLRHSATPFCFGEYVLNQKGDYYTVIGCAPVDQFTGIITDVDSYYAGSVMLDALRSSTKVGDEIAPLIVAVLKYLKTLAYEECDKTLLLVSFMLDFMKEAGYGLEFSKCKVCRSNNFTKRFLSFSQGGIVCNVCAKRDDEPISGQGAGLLKAISDGISLSVLRYDESVKREVLTLLNTYFGYVFGRKLSSVNQYLDISKSV